MSDLVPGDDVPEDAEALLPYILDLVEHGRRTAAIQVNTTLTVTCWPAGRAISANKLRNGCAVYGQEILATLSQELGAQFRAGTDAIGNLGSVNYS